MHTTGVDSYNSGVLLKGAGHGEENESRDMAIHLPGRADDWNVSKIGHESKSMKHGLLSL